MKKQLLFIVMMLLPMVASADDSGACGENVTYTYVESTHILTISGTGAMADYKWDNHNHAPWYSYRSEIVKVIIENGVTSIGDEAIEECYNLTSIEIPNSVVSIGDRAIFGCFSLSILKIPGSVKSIGRFAFAACGLTSIEIPNSVTSINGNVFIDCDGLTSIKVANGNAVYDSRNNCNAIIETQSNTLICGCMNTIIPNDVTSIGGSAFENCDGLTSVEIPNSVTSIGNNAFFFTGLTSIVIPNSVKSIGRFAFSYCSGLTSVTISNSVTSIGDDAFSYCSGLTSVTIPNSVTSIGESAFQCCKGLTSITIPNSVTSIGDYAFSGCTGLIDVYCYAVVNAPRTGIHAFEFSTHATLHVPLEFYDTYMTTVPWSYFETIVRIDVDDIQIDGLRYELIGTNNAKVIKYMNNNQYCGDIVIPETIEYKGVNYSVTCIDEEAFGDCDGLTSVTIPNSVTSIEEWAFHGCRSLTSITIGSGVNDIYFNAFANCPKLTDIYCYAVRVPSIINPMHDYLTPIPWDSSMFGRGLTFHVPALSFNAYKMNPSWGDFNVVGIPGTEPTTYKLIYIVDGVEYRTYDIEAGASITPEPSPIMEGCTFSGWDYVPTTMPEKDVTVNGSFTINIDPVLGENAIGAEEVTALVGTKITLPIVMNNTENIIGMQFDLTLPEGVSVVTDEDNEYMFTLTNRAASSHSIIAEKMSDGSYRVLVSSLQNSKFKGTEGAIMEAMLAIANDMVAGEYPVKIANIEMSTAQNVAIRPDAFVSRLTVQDIKPGDANGDGTVSVTDVTMAISYILGQAPDGFNKDAADLNSDGSITITDVTMIIAIILGNK